MGLTYQSQKQVKSQIVSEGEETEGESVLIGDEEPIVSSINEMGQVTKKGQKTTVAQKGSPRQKIKDMKQKPFRKNQAQKEELKQNLVSFNTHQGQPKA